MIFSVWEMSKNKAKKPNAKGAADDDDDWEAILAEEAKVNGASQVKEQVADVAAAQPVPPQVDEKVRYIRHWIVHCLLFLTSISISGIGWW